MVMTPIRNVLQATSTWLWSRVSLRDQHGATAVEYGIVAVFIAAVIVVAVVFLGSSTNHSLDCSGKTIALHAPQCP
jgi:Flp pilus assembly pilin Flp